MHCSTDIDAQAVYRYVKWLTCERSAVHVAEPADIGPHPLWAHFQRMGVVG